MVRFLESSSMTDQSHQWDSSSCDSSRATTKTKTNRTNVAQVFDRITAASTLYNQLMEIMEHTDKVLAEDIPNAVSTTLYETKKRIRDSINESFTTGLGTLIDKDRTDFLKEEKAIETVIETGRVVKVIETWRVVTHQGIAAYGKQGGVDNNSTQDVSPAVFQSMLWTDSGDVNEHCWFERE